MSHNLNLLLVGYWGNGKSATANTLLGYDAFPKNNSTVAMNTVPSGRTSKDGKITVVDGLCLWGKDPKSLDNDTLFDAQTAVAECGGKGFDAIIIVLRYGETYSEDEAKLVEVIKKIFGPKIFGNFGLCLVTRGDDFKYAVEEGEEPCKTFEQWFRTRTGNLGKLFQECGQRCVLIDNKTKDPKQKEDVLTLVHKVSGNGARRYTMNEFRRVNGREFSPSDRKMLEMKTRSNLQIIRQRLKSNPGERDLQKLAEELRKLSCEVAAKLKDHQPMGALIAEAQTLNKMIKSALDKMSTGSSQELSGIMTGGSSQASGKQLGELTFNSDHFNQDTFSSKPDDSRHRQSDSQHTAGEAQKSFNNFKEALNGKTSTSPELSQETAQVGQLYKEKANELKDDDKVTDDVIRLLLLGTSGNGKSSTGNSILGQAAFKISSNTASAKSLIEERTENVGHLNVSVVDGPSLDDAVLDANTDLDQMIESIKKALQLCDYSFSGLLVVLKFGQRFTKQEKDAIVLIKSILGKDVLRNYGVCVMTHGDDYDSSMEDDDERVDFDDWCRRQTGDIAELFQECSYRCVLFDNKTRDERAKLDQRIKLLSLVQRERKYSEEEFIESEKDFKDLCIQCAIPLLEQKTSTILTKIRQQLDLTEQESPRDSEKYKLRLEALLKDTQEYKENIEFLGQSSSTEYILQLVSTLELQINSKLRLCLQKEELRELDTERRQLYEKSDSQNVPINLGLDERLKYPDDPSFGKMYLSASDPIRDPDLTPLDHHKSRLKKEVEESVKTIHFLWREAKATAIHERIPLMNEILYYINAQLEKIAFNGLGADALNAQLMGIKREVENEITQNSYLQSGNYHSGRDIETFREYHGFEIIDPTPLTYPHPTVAGHSQGQGQSPYYQRHSQSYLTCTPNIRLPKMPKCVAKRWKSVKTFLKRLKQELQL